MPTGRRSSAMPPSTASGSCCSRASPRSTTRRCRSRPPRWRCCASSTPPSCPIPARCWRSWRAARSSRRPPRRRPKAEEQRELLQGAGRLSGAGRALGDGRQGASRPAAARFRRSGPLRSRPSWSIRPIKPLPGEFIRDLGAALKALTGTAWQVRASDEEAAAEPARPGEGRRRAPAPGGARRAAGQGGVRGLSRSRAGGLQARRTTERMMQNLERHHEDGPGGPGQADAGAGGSRQGRGRGRLGRRPGQDPRLGQGPDHRRRHRREPARRRPRSRWSRIWSPPRSTTPAPRPTSPPRKRCATSPAACSCRRASRCRSDRYTVDAPASEPVAADAAHPRLRIRLP